MKSAVAMLMLAILGYLGAVAALVVGAAMGLMVLFSESAGLGKQLAAYSDPPVAGPAKPARPVGSELDASAAFRTTGLATRDDWRPDVRPKGPKTRSANINKRKKRTAQGGRERR
jgi:hypothetical protein